MLTTVTPPSFSGTIAFTQAWPPQSLKSHPPLLSMNAGICPSSNHAGIPAALAMEVNKMEKSSQSPILFSIVSSQLFGTDDGLYV